MVMTIGKMTSSCLFTDDIRPCREIGSGIKLMLKTKNSKFQVDEILIETLVLVQSKYIPIVDINVVLKASSENLNRRQVFPTPESPIRSNLNNKSYVFLAIFLVYKMVKTVSASIFEDGNRQLYMIFTALY